MLPKRFWNILKVNTFLIGGRFLEIWLCFIFKVLHDDKKNQNCNKLLKKDNFYAFFVFHEAHDWNIDELFVRKYFHRINSSFLPEVGFIDKWDFIHPSHHNHFRRYALKLLDDLQGWSCKKFLFQDEWNKYRQYIYNRSNHRSL